MNPDLIDRLEKSFNLLAPRGPELVDRFYAHLFSRNPQLRPIFPQNLSDQKKKLLASLLLVVHNLRSPQNLVQPLQDMGQRHVQYGTKPEHYPVVRDTMVQVMSEMAGEAWNKQLTQDWNAAIDLVASIMLQGANNPHLAHQR